MIELLNDLKKNNNIQIEDILSREDINKNDFYKQCALFFDMEFIDLEKNIFDISLHQNIPFDFLEKHSLIVYKENKETITLLSFSPINNPIYEIINFSGKNVIFNLCLKSQIDKYLFRMKSVKKIYALVYQSLLQNKDNPSLNNIPEIISMLFKNAISMNASDIHFEYKKKSISIIRYRINNDLHKIMSMNNTIFKALMSVIKLRAKIDTFNNLSPQDGRFSMEIDNLSYDFRLSSIPLYNGESLAVRVLKTKNEFIQLDTLLLPSYSVDILKSKSLKSNSLILFTGPTGSGKTTTLYATLNEIVSESKKIITIEDPVEYDLQGIEQVQISKNTKLSFNNILKSVLRHDPDIIMIGEIRDNESLNLVLQASLTGHLVLSTLHTKDAISTIIRLKEMGVEDYMIIDAISSIHSSRLLKRLCDNCKNIYSPSKKLIKQYELKDIIFYEKNGCEKCQMTGYSSRISICETLDVSLIFYDEKISTNYNTTYQKAIKNGFIPMIEHGLSKVKNGDIDISDLLNQIYIR
jgi:general secretion pathway protein E